MKKIWSPLIAAILTAVLIIFTAGCVGAVQSEKELRQANENMRQILQSKLQNLNNAVARAAEKIAVSGLQGDETRGILSGVCKKYPYLVDCSTADPQGKLITVEPEAYRRFEGTETANTEDKKKYQAKVAENRKPMLSSVFRAVESMDAVVMVWPVITEKGELLGFVGALFKPGDMLSGTAAPASELRAINVNVAQTDGLTIYDSNGRDTGSNVLTDPKFKDYPELLAMGQKLTAEETGTCKYTYLSGTTGQPVTKTVTWATIGLHGTEWRLASVAELGD
jgi:hypothetical protein